MSILEGIKAVVFDMDGVIRIGDKKIDGAETIFEQLNSKNIKTMIVTNECRYTVKELKNDLCEMGVSIPQTTQIITPGLMIFEYLEKKIIKNPQEQFYIGVIGENGLHVNINNLNKYPNVKVSSEPPENINNRQFTYLIVGTVNRIKMCTLDKGLNWAKAKAKIITTCNDVSDPNSKGDFNIGMPNHILHILNFTIKTNSYSLGKPSPFIAKKIHKELELSNPNEILFIGDTLYTDIQFAEESEFKSLLVLSGNTKKEGVKSYVTEADLILPSIKDLYKILVKRMNPSSPI